MKTNKAFELIEKGLSAKTVLKLNENEINILHSKLVGEAVSKITTTSYKIPASDATLGATVNLDGQNAAVKKNPDGSLTLTPTEEAEIKEDDNSDLVNQDLTKKLTGQVPADDEDDSPNDGMDDDTDPHNKNLSSVGMTEGKEKTKKNDNNPWAICTSQLGKEFKTTERHLWNTRQKNKYERCVKDVKKSLKEGKNPLSLFIESQIMKIVERNIPPRITKGDLMKYIIENDTKTAPAKPKEEPGTKEKPSRPTERPSKPPRPGRRHTPEKRPEDSPRAEKTEGFKRKSKISHDEAKKKIIDTIINMLKK